MHQLRQAVVKLPRTSQNISSLTRKPAIADKPVRNAGRSITLLFCSYTKLSVYYASRKHHCHIHWRLAAGLHCLENLIFFGTFLALTL